ncbi:hypothetical protein [Georgenia sp. SYP-B2076]|uniref:hypothetical protein n=1 Tax=Georgenia sp. SYP-B2076 TaxID=2495881 RepID=UPI0013DF4B11|nr:hypothetical protein [Georgenia sp. SYP-B2076]
MSSDVPIGGTSTSSRVRISRPTASWKELSSVPSYPGGDVRDHEQRAVLADA